MDVVPEHGRLLPIACTLGPSEGAERLAEWRDLGTTAGLGRIRSTGHITLRFADIAGVDAALRRLVAAERDCCAFVDWELVRSDDEWQVTIYGTDDALDSIPVA